MGGGCFFCHPDWETILVLNSELKLNLKIDIPLNIEMLTILQNYPCADYHYTYSISLWGIGVLHDQLTGYPTSFDMLSKFVEFELQASAKLHLSFVITKELIQDIIPIVTFINQIDYKCNIYFYRLMPSGRCSATNLPPLNSIIEFMIYTLSYALLVSFIQPHPYTFPL